MKKAFVIGWPISHSLSPVLHRFWIKRHGIDAAYEKIPVEPQNLKSFLSSFGNDGYHGGNVTLPHKEEALKLCAVTEDDAQAIGAANTLWSENGRLCGTNTDSYGFSKNLDDQVPGWDDVDEVLILGAGGAARAVIHAVLKRGIPKIYLANRTIMRAEDLATHFGSTVVPCRLDDISPLMEKTPLIINTTSLGMVGQDPLNINLNPASPQTIVTDLVYTPLETPLLVQARKLGLRTADGLGMLLHQAVPGFTRWFDIEPQVDQELRFHVLEEMAARDNARHDDAMR